MNTGETSQSNEPLNPIQSPKPMTRNAEIKTQETSGFSVSA